MTDYPSAMRHMVDRDFLRSQKYGDQKMRASSTGAHPDIVVFLHAFQAKFEKLGIPMFATEIWRSEKKQNDAYIGGFSKAKPGHSPHQYGCAVDIIHSRKGWELPKESWDLIGHIGKELALQRGLQLKWGGDFRVLYDPAHWEIIDWKSHKMDPPL